MLQICNGCYCSILCVPPKNWKTTSASIKKQWRITYRYYDPTVRDENGNIKPKQVAIKGMNKFTSAIERSDATKALLDHELRLLVDQGYNPITKQFMIEEEQIDYEIDPSTPFIKALLKAKDKLTVGHRTMIGIESVITGMSKAADQLRFSYRPISEIRWRHIKAKLERVGENSKQWSNGRYNLYRAYLMTLYKELVELEAVEYNIIKDISKKPVEQKLKTILTDKQRKQVNDHLLQTFPRFQKFIHLFFHSGGMKTELLQLKPGNVDLVNQKYRTMIHKRKQHVEDWRTLFSQTLKYS